MAASGCRGFRKYNSRLSDTKIETQGNNRFRFPLKNQLPILSDEVLPVAVVRLFVH